MNTRSENGFYRGFCSLKFFHRHGFKSTKSMQGSYTFFDQKFKDFSMPIKDTFFHFLRTQEGQNQAHIMATSDAQSRECADFRLRHLRSFVG